MNQLKKNFLYSIMYQVLTILFPIITVPYISRVIGADGVGIFSYTYTLVYYFMTITMLGISNYGNRKIAKCRENKEELSKNFLSIYSIQLFMSIIMIIFYILYIIFFATEYKLFMLLQIFYLLSSTFDINWLFFGLEKIKLTIVRSAIVKIISIIGIFLLVKNKEDLNIYTIIMSGSTFISQAFLIFFLFKEIKLCKIKFSDIKPHIKPSIILFVPVIAMSFYKLMDKIMLGNLSTVIHLGYYEQAEKLINIPVSIITALGTVMLPRISNLVAKGEEKSISEYIRKSLNFTMFLTLPICFGLIAISNDFIPLFLGKEFQMSSILIYYLAPTLIFVSISNIIRTQYLIPKEQDKTYIISMIIGAIINLIINYLLIPKYNAIGACIGTIFAEFIVMIYHIIDVKKEIPIFKYLKESIPFLIKSIIMFSITMLIKLLDFNSAITIIIQVFTGILIYLILNLKYINNIIDIKSIFKKILHI